MPGGAPGQDLAIEDGVALESCRYADLGVDRLDPDEGRQRSAPATAGKNVVREFDVVPLETLADRVAAGDAQRGVQAGRVADVALGPQSTQPEAPVTPVEVEVEDLGAGVDRGACRVQESLAGVPDVGGDADDQPGRRGVVQSPGPGEVLRLRPGALLAAAAKAVGAEAGALQAVDDVAPVGEGTHVAEDAGPVLAPGTGDQDLLHVGALRAREERGLVQFVEPAHGKQQDSRTEVQLRLPQVVDVRELDGGAAGLRCRGVLELDLRVEHPPVVELVADVDDGAQEVDRVAEAGRFAALALAGVALEHHLAVAADRQAFLHAVDLRGGDAHAVEAFIGFGGVGRRGAEVELLDFLGEDLDLLFQFGHSLGGRLGGEFGDRPAQGLDLLLQRRDALIGRVLRGGWGGRRDERRHCQEQRQ